MHDNRALARIDNRSFEAAPLARILSAVDTVAEELRSRAHSPNTRNAYRQGQAAFARFCDRAELASLPATPATVIRFIALLAATARAPSTIALRVASIRFAHLEAGLVDPTDDPAVHAVLRGVRRTAAELGRRPHKAVGIDVDALRRMVAAATGARAARNVALLLLTWHGALRRSEVAALELADVAFVDGGLEVTIRRSKADQEGLGAVLAIPDAVDGRLCAVRALRAYATLRGDGAGSLFGLHAEQVNRIVKRLGRAAGLATSAHGCRRGWVTAAVRSGRRVDEIRCHSRHASLSAFSEYVESAARWSDPIRLA